ncbi:hypothetical protein QF028_004948 [Neobacillus sp. B4I6]|uniref:hypothetical protein n=1 Tax=Neobacillus sp. B4I6 TaxID=3373925 RepID=UPI003D24E885
MDDILKKISIQLNNEAEHNELYGTVIEAINWCEKTEQLKGYYHPLGFIHIPLGKVNKQSIRLHIWSHQERRKQQPFYPIHTHIFELKSHLLYGSLKNRIYEISTENFPLENVIYSVDYNSQVSILKRTEKKINYKQITEGIFQKGDYYSVKKGNFHSSEVNEGQFTATIVLTSDIENSTPLVIGDAIGNAEYWYSRDMCTKEELLKITSYLKQCN